MTATGLLFLEIALDMPKDSNIISMADRYLGKAGKIFSWIVYLFLFYCLSIAYISGGGALVKNLVGDYLSPNSCSLLFAIFFGFFVYIGALAVDRINIFLMVGLVVSYLIFVILGINHVDINKLGGGNFKYTIFSFPVILISFGYQGIIPSLTYYMNKDYKKIRSSIVIGTSIAFLIYLVWEFLIVGIIPIEGKFGLKEAYLNNQDAIQPLKYYTKIKMIYLVGRFFSFFSITTSFLGVSLGLFDFIADGFKIKKQGYHKLLIAFITFLPPIIITLINPNLFLTALNYAGGIGGSLLLVLLPCVMVFSKRYLKKENRPFLVSGGKITLIFIIIFVVFILSVEIIQEILHFVS